MDRKSIKPLEDLIDGVRNIDGFPTGKQTAIIKLSDPPFYTACPNPYITQFIEEYGILYDSDTDQYERTPYIGDVSEGKNNPIYNAYSYHTKVPHSAIMKYIEHYTNPGDIIFDGFCGSGMTGVASQMLNRKAILVDLSPSATFITYNYTHVPDPSKFKNFCIKLLKNLKKECGWLYKTYHSPNAWYSSSGKKVSMEKTLFNDKIVGDIEYTIWSEIFICPYCNVEFHYWDVAVNHSKKKVLKDFLCSNCNAKLTKRDCKKKKITLYDSLLRKNVEYFELVPVLINYVVGKNRYEKIPDKEDLEILKKIEETEIPYNIPIEKVPIGDKTNEAIRLGMTYVHHFFTKRNLWLLGYLNSKLSLSTEKIILLMTLMNTSKMSRYGSRTGTLSGTIYFPSLVKELNVIKYIERKLYGPKGIIKPIEQISKKSINHKSIISTQSITSLNHIPNSCIDYIFTDPPFGANLMYSELSFIWESWLELKTNIKKEAIINRSQNKDLEEYTELMTLGFKEMFRILKPNRWITVEFHNSKASVWNAIQESMTRAGFIIAQVAVLDKKIGSYNQVTASGSVKNDLIINAYKPKTEFSQRFISNAGMGMELDFVIQQLEHLPIKPNIERTEKMLYSKMLAHYVENGFKIKYNSNEFYYLLINNFTDLDGYWFIAEQVREYNEWKSHLSLDQMKEVQQQVLFISDESSALTWLFHFLHIPRTYSEIYTAYQQVVTNIDDKIPELKELLDNNFIIENGKYRRPINQNEKESINENREKELDRVFQKLLNQTIQQKGTIKEIRKEALLFGFTKLYKEEKYNEILTIANKLTKNILESSGEIMDFVDIAKLKTES